MTKPGTHSLSRSMTPTPSPLNSYRVTKITSKPTILNQKQLKKTSLVTGGLGTSQKESGGQSIKNATKKEEHQEKSVVSMKVIEEYFDITNDEDTEEESTDVDSQKSIEKTENKETEDIRKELVRRCKSSEVSKRTSPEVERGMLAISYIKSIAAKSTKIPAATRRAIEQVLQIVINSLMELETRAVHAEAKVVVMEQVPVQGMTIHEEREINEEQVSKETSVAKTYARALQEATATVIVQAKEERTADEVERQIVNKVQNKDGVKSVKKIRNGMKIICESAQQATRIKEALAEGEEKDSGLNIKTANMKMKRIIIFHAPEDTEETAIKLKICKKMGINSEENMDKIRTLRYLRASTGKVHIPVSLPESLANHMLKERTICLGLRECPVKNYVTILRCHRCQGFDHLANQCPQKEEYCSICAGHHKYEDCPKRTKRCIMCSTFNQWNRGHLVAPIPVDHTAHDGRCRVFRKLMTIRQLELEKGKTKLTSGEEVLKDLVTVNTFRGVPRVFRRTQAELREREQRVQELSRVNYEPRRR